MQPENENDEMIRESNPFGDAPPFDPPRDYHPPKEGAQKLDKPYAVITPFTQIEAEEISWLWKNRIALGKFTMIAGDPGLGKSLLTTTFAACVSRGYPWPIDKTPAPIGDVVIISAEDDAADTIKPRLEAAGADMSRVHVLEAIYDKDASGKRLFSLGKDIEALKDAVAKLSDCRLIIIDPISAYLGDKDSNKNAEIRGLLAPLTELGKEYKIAIVGVSHFNKNVGSNPLYRTTGSLAFTAAGRAVYIVAKDKHKDGRVFFMPVKNNLARDKTGLAYAIGTNEKGQPVIQWESEPVHTTADEALTPPNLAPEDNDTNWVVETIRDILSVGAVPQQEVLSLARAEGVSAKQARTAGEKLGVQRRKVGFNPSYWEWALPNEGAQDAHTSEVGTFDDSGHLRDEL